MFISAKILRIPVMPAEHETGLSFLFDTAYRYQPDFHRFVSNYVALLKHDNPYMDETQMNLAQQTLQIEFYRQCLESLGVASFDCLLILDYNGLLLEINTIAEKTLALKRDEALGQPFFEKLFPGHQIDEYLAWIKKHAKADDSLHRKSTEMLMVKANGTIFPAEIKVTELKVFSSALLVICFNDITRRKWMDQALKYTEERYRKIMGENADAIFLLDPFNKRIEESNPAFNIMLGYNSDELFALRIYDVMEGDPEIIDAWVEKRLKQGTSFLFREQGRFRNRGQHYVDVEFTTSVFDLRDHPILCIIARDTVPREHVVRRSLADQQITLLQHQLSKLASRLEEIKQTKLTGAQNEIIEEMLTCHQQLVAEIDTEVDSLAKGPLPVERRPQPFELKAVLYQVQSFFKQALAEKELPLQVDVEPDVPDVLIGDPLQLQEILYHILDNAVAHTTEGNVLLKVRFNPLNAVDASLLFTIRDSGNGIDTVTKAKMTDVLSDSNPLETGKKYGIRGLAICAHLVKALKGKIWFNTLAGKGSSFLFSLPMETTEKEPEDLPELTQDQIWQHMQVVDDALAALDSIPEDSGFTLIDVPSAPVEASQSVTAATAASLGRALRVLLVESDVDHAIDIQRYLSGQKVEMLMVDNGRKALELVQEQEFDMVLMALDLPIMDGKAAAIAIRDWENQQRRKPILMVAFAPADTASEAESEDFMRICTAPLAESELQELMDWALQELSGQAEPVREAASAPPASEPVAPVQTPPAPEPKAEPEPVLETEADEDTERITVQISADMAKMAPDFLAKRSKDVVKIRQALAENKLDSVRVLGKSMKGTGAVYGFDAIAEIGKELEEAAANQSQADVEEWLNYLDNYLQRVEITVAS